MKTRPGPRGAKELPRSRTDTTTWRFCPKWHTADPFSRALCQAIRAGLVDEYHLFLVATMLGGGTQVLPGDARIRLELVDERRSANGMGYLRYHAQA